MPRASTGAKQQLSDSDGYIPGKPPLKRQKMASDREVIIIDDDVVMADVTVPLDYDPDRNATLKGRKRFNADLGDLKEACATGLGFEGLKILKVRPGDDEGAVEVVIAKDTREHVLAINLFVAETSEYPKSHSLFCYSPDSDLSAKLQRIVDEVAETSPKPLGRTIRDLVASVAKVILAASSGKKPAIQTRQQDSDEEDLDEDDEGDDYDAYEDYDDIAAAPVESESVMAILQQNFIDTVATEYRPGFVRLGGNDFVTSVSLPVIELANLIPPRALMAWDRRLLSCSQHLTLLISGFHGLYPVLETDGSYSPAAQRLGVSLTFKVGLSEKYKPGREQVQEVVRRHGLIITDAEDEVRKQEELAAQQAAMEHDWEAEAEEEYAQAPAAEEEEIQDPGRFDRFSLSSSLETLMDQSFLKLVKLRRAFGLGWAGAEYLHAEIERSQMKDADVLAAHRKAIKAADKEEREIDTLPHDPLANLDSNELFNLPLTAFCYLIRRLALCTKFCIVCHNKLQSDYEALKPYVCDSKLCAYQYYSLNRGPSLEYEIMHNPQTVDLLVSLAYVSAIEGAMDDPLPIGMGLRVPKPTADAVANAAPVPAYSMPGHAQPATPEEIPKTLIVGSDGLVDFDDLTRSQMRYCLAKLLNTLPSIMDMKKHLERKVKAGKRKPVLKEIDPAVIPAAWSLLRWCVASCTAHIEAIDSKDEVIKNLDPSWRQFRMTVGAPAAEAQFKDAVAEAQTESPHAIEYPVIYAFHGSPLKNWHSIIRHGLWFRTVAHGRAYGNGVYLAKDAQTSMGYYSQSGRSSWQRTMTGPTNCMALAEIVNLPAKFVSTNPHYVIQNTHWIMCRYLLVKGLVDPNSPVVPSTPADSESERPEPKGSKRSKKAKNTRAPYVTLDPQHKTAVNGKVIEIPEPQFRIDTILEARKGEFVHEDADEEDMSIFNLDTTKKATSSQQHDVFDLDDDDDYKIPVASSSKPKAVAKPTRPLDDWKHDPEYVTKTLESLMIPPFESSPGATMAIQRELKSMIKEQDSAPSLRDLGWYMPPDLIGDNLYQWIVEMHSFDPALPLAKDLKAKKVNSIIFEIRFPPAFPNSPPYFRIITPRFLPFIHGGGGHVTGGGSICMDLLTTDGWLPSYSISAVLMQIRLALSNLDPKPARLVASNWNQSYGIDESLAGFRRAAATHGWTVPAGLERLVR